MIRFKAYTYEGKTYINDDIYQSGEILTRYLNRDFAPLIRYYKRACGLASCIYSAKDIRSFHAAIEAGQRFMTYIDERLPQYPLYNRLISDTHFKGNKLLSLYEESRHLFEMVDSSYWEEKKSWEYRVKGEDEAYGNDNDDDDLDDDDISSGRGNRRRMLGKPDEHDADYYTSVESAYGDDKDITAFRGKVNGLFQPYLTFVQDVMRLQNVYVPLLDQYIHTGPTMPNAMEIANAIAKFNRKTSRGKPLIVGFPQIEKKLLPAENVTIAYEGVPVDTPGGMQNVLCQTITFDSLGAFLYHELMTGLLSGMPPKRCKNCGVFFLLQNGYYTDYCDDIAPGETMKTCRDVGARKRFDEKVKQDPVWLAYQRAYKAHYARVMKKKMTKPDFAAWSEMAIDLRTKALNKEIPFEEYARIIKE